MNNYIVERLDDKPGNVTFGSWVTVSLFQSYAMANDYVLRAQSETQKLRVVPSHELINSLLFRMTGEQYERMAQRCDCDHYAGEACEACMPYGFIDTTDRQ